MAKLRDLINESKFLKREFGEALPTFKGVMKQHQINKLEEGWWDNMSDVAKKAYIKKHGEAPDANGDDEPKVPAPDSKSDTGKPRVSANPYDDNYGQEVDDEDDYDMGVEPGSRDSGPWTPEDDPDFEHGPSLTSAPGRVPDEDDEDDEESSGRTGKELDQETLTIDGKQFRRISEVEQKPKYEFSEFYKRFKR